MAFSIPETLQRLYRSALTPAKFVCYSSAMPLPTDLDPPRPLPRRPTPRAQAARANRPRFAWQDGLWMAALAALSLAFSAYRGSFATGHTAGALAAAGTVLALYLLGWRARDRAAGVSSGLMAATSQAFLMSAAYSPQNAAFMLLTVAALFAFVAGSSLVALGLAAIATFVRPDGLLLGVLLLGLALAQQRKRAIYGAAVFLVPLMAIWSGRIALGLGLPPLPNWGFHPEVLRWLGTPATALLAWLLLPLCAELSEPMRRARWLPVLLWTAVGWTSASLLSDTTPTGMLLPAMPLLFALAGGGLSRLLPTLAGEFPRPLTRYALATLAVLGLIGLHVWLEPNPLPLLNNLNSAIMPSHHSR